MMTSLSFTGSVMSISSVPDLFSSATSRMVTTGTMRRTSPVGIASNIDESDARSTCQNLPGQMNTATPRSRSERQMTT
jgi:hypothetical protein